LNASDDRSATAVRTFLDRLRRTATLPIRDATRDVTRDVTRNANRRMIVMDEVDGMSAGDRGGIAEISRAIREGTVGCPVICLANERSAPKLRPLASVCVDIRCCRPTKTTIAKTIVGRLEGQWTVQQIETMCEQNGNDIRSILNTLQFGCSGAGVATTAKDESHRLDPFSATGRLFGTSATMGEREQAFFVDHSLVPLMVAEGYVAAAGKSSNPLHALSVASDAVSDWDIMDRRIHARQEWSLLPAAAMSIIHAARAADGPAPFQIFPSWLGKQSKRIKHRRLMGEIRHLAGSGEAELDTRCALRTVLYATPVSPTSAVDRLCSLGLSRDTMLETLVETVFKGDEDTVALDTKTKSAITREWKRRFAGVGAGAAGNAAIDDDDIIDANDDDIDELDM
jgi:replication factor C subunit 1